MKSFWKTSPLVGATPFGPALLHWLIALLLSFSATLLQADDFSTGIDAYHDDRYTKAEAAFERSLEHEETAAVRHNLALSLYRQERFAEALWQLERALRIDPLSQSYRVKLGALRQQMGLTRQPDASWVIASSVFSFGTWVWLASLSFWVLLAAFLLPRFADRKRPLFGKIMASISLVILVFSISALTIQRFNAVSATVIAETPVPLHHAPAGAAPEAGQANPGERTRQIDQFKDFWKVKTESGLIGWIQSDALRKL